MAKLPNIGIVSPMYGGKTSVANYLGQMWGYTNLALASPLKNIEALIDDNPRGAKDLIYTLWALHDTQNGKYGQYDYSLIDREIDWIISECRAIERETPKPRKRLQFLGTEGIRKSIDEDFWVNLWLATVSQFRATPSMKFSCDDVRFTNEAEILTKNEVSLIYLHVDRKEQMQRMAMLGVKHDESVFEHASETGPLEVKKLITSSKLPGKHFIVDSNYSLPEVYMQISDILKRLAHE